MAHIQSRKAATAVEYGLIAGAILGVILLPVTQLGRDTANLFSSMGNSVSTSNSSNDSNSFCPVNNKSLAYPAGWSAPTSCQTGFIAPPTSMLYPGHYTIVYANGFPYAGLMGGSAVGNTYPASGTVFNDGYSFNSDYVSQTGLTFANFSSSCQSGFTGEYPTGGTNSYQGNYYGGVGSGADRPYYSPGKAIIDSAGNYVCYGATMIAGYLN